MVQQNNLNQGLKLFGDQGKDAVTKEMGQLYNEEALVCMNANKWMEK